MYKHDIAIPVPTKGSITRLPGLTWPMLAMSSDRPASMLVFPEIQSTHLKMQSTHLKIQSTHLKTQSTHLKIQSTHSKIQSTHLKIQSTHLKIQSTHLKIQSTHLKIQSTHLKIQSTHLKIQSTHLKIQSTHLTQNIYLYIVSTNAHERGILRSKKRANFQLRITQITENCFVHFLKAGCKPKWVELEVSIFGI